MSIGPENTGIVGIIGTPPPPQPTFNFSVSSINVKNPRAAINDTDSATLSINALAADGSLLHQYGPVTRSLGNHGKNATFDPGMSLTGIVVPEGGSLAVSFVVVNKGDWIGDLSSEAVTALEGAGAAVLGALAQGQIAAPTTPTSQPITIGSVGTGLTVVGSTTTASVPLAEAAAIGAAIIVVLEGINILFADCDGTVVPGVLSLGQSELQANAVPGPWDITITYPGTDSPTGCGANSDYVVTYSVIGGVSWVAVPTVIGLSPKAANAALVAAGLTVVTSFVTDRGDVSEVINQSPPGGSSVPVSSVIQIEIGLPEGNGNGGGSRQPP